MVNSDEAVRSGTAVFVLVACEGPDRYASVGGLGSQYGELARQLARRGAETHYFFFGDPALPPRERPGPGRLTLHRWGQWLSRQYPGGPYDGESARIRDLASSLPSYILENLIDPALSGHFSPIVLAADWQTAPFVVALGKALHARELSGRVRLMWQGSAPEFLDRVDLPALARWAEIYLDSPDASGTLRRAGIEVHQSPTVPAEWLRVLGVPDVPAVAGRRIRSSRRRVGKS